MSTDGSIAFPRNAVIAKIVASILLLSLGAFFVPMAVLISHASELKCEQARCVHIERYPGGIVQESPVPHVKHADTEWDPGGRSKALKLVLEHEDGSTTEYQGVGKNGDRAQRTARAINSYLADPAGAKTFQLREGSLLAAGFMLLLALVCWAFVPSFFSKVRLRTSATAMQVTIGRWPAPRRVYSVPLDELQGFALLRSVANEQEFFTLCARQSGRKEGIELGMRFHLQSSAERRMAELNDWLLTATSSTQRPARVRGSGPSVVD